MSRELEECKTQLRVTIAKLEESQKASYDNPGVNPKGERDDESHLRRQLMAGEHILMQVRQEKNNLQEANVRLDVELKDIRAQLADSVKENKRLQRGIYGMLMGRPEEEMPSSIGDVLQELS